MNIDPFHPWAELRALVALLESWLVWPPKIITDAIVGIGVVIMIWLVLMWATSGDQGRHTARERRHLHAVPDHVPPEPSHDLLTTDDCQLIELRADVEHAGATEDWHPAHEVHAVDNADAEWDAYLRSATRERTQLRNDDVEFFVQWDRMLADFQASMAAPVAQADAWHAEHGRHCACCHVGIGTSDERMVWAEWRSGEATIEIKRSVILAASGVH
jgi:hypothetical protein